MPRPSSEAPVLTCTPAVSRRVHLAGMGAILVIIGVGVCQTGVLWISARRVDAVQSSFREAIEKHIGTNKPSRSQIELAAYEGRRSVDAMVNEINIAIGLGVLVTLIGTATIIWQFRRDPQMKPSRNANPLVAGG